MEIRRLGPADAADYRAIRLEALQHEPDAFGSTYALEVKRPLSHFGERLESAQVFAAYSDANRIVGMIGLKQFAGQKDAHKAFVWGFYVQPEHRREGIGAALITTLIAAAQPLVEQLTLEVVSDNTAAIALYTRVGFQTYGIEPRSMKKSATEYADSVLMALFLEPNLPR